MCKFATTVLALALATTHGLLDEGGPIVQCIVRDPRPLRPPARKRRNETQANTVPVTFECYDAPVTVGAGAGRFCP